MKDPLASGPSCTPRTFPETISHSILCILACMDSKRRRKDVFKNKTVSKLSIQLSSGDDRYIFLYTRSVISVLTNVASCAPHRLRISELRTGETGGQCCTEEYRYPLLIQDTTYWLGSSVQSQLSPFYSDHQLEKQIQQHRALDL